MTINPKRVTRLGTKKRSNIATSSQRAADSRRIKEALMGGFRKPRTAIVGDGNGNVDAVAISGAPNTIYFKYPSDVTDEQRWAYVDWAQNDERFVHGTVILVEPSHENPREMVVRGYDPLRTKFQHEVRPNFREPSAAFTHTFDFEVAHECWVPNNSATHYVPLNGWDVSSGDTLYVKKMGFESFILTSIQTVWQNAWASFPGAGGGVFIYDQDGTLLASEEAFPVAGVDLTIDNYEVTGIKVQAVRTGPGTETGLVDAYLSSIIISGIGINPFEDEICPDTLPIQSLTGTATPAQLPTDIVYLASAQTLTSKTLTSPVVNGGTLNNVTALTVASTSIGSIPMPKMTEVQRDAIVTPVTGSWVFNTDSGTPNFFDGTDWIVVDSAGIQSPATLTKGDMLVYNGTDWVKHDSGTDGQLITYDAAEATGIKNITLTPSDIGTLVVSDEIHRRMAFIYAETLVAPGVFDISSIPNTYRHLFIELDTRTTDAVTADQVYLFHDTDITVTNYHRQGIGGSNSAVFNDETNTPQICGTTGASAPTDEFGHAEIKIYNYANARPKQAESRFIATVGALNMQIGGYGHHWSGTTAIDRIRVQPDGYAASSHQFAAGSSIRVYGIGDADVVNSVELV
jgi:hypothetical protein